MSGREELLQELTDVIREEGCGVSCEEATLYKDEDLEMFHCQPDHITGLRMIRHVFLEKCTDAFRSVDTDCRHDRGDHSLVEQWMKGF